MAVYKSITFDNRKKIAALYAKGMSISDISDEVASPFEHCMSN